MALPLAIDWVEAAQVSITGFVGVFVTLTLLYLCTLLYGAAVRRFDRAGAEDKK